jgi:hypothetical protein
LERLQGLLKLAQENLRKEMQSIKVSQGDVRRTFGLFENDVEVLRDGGNQLEETLPSFLSNVREALRETDDMVVALSGHSEGTLEDAQSLRKVVEEAFDACRGQQGTENP